MVWAFHIAAGSADAMLLTYLASQGSCQKLTKSFQIVERTIGCPPVRDRTLIRTPVRFRTVPKSPHS